MPKHMSKVGYVFKNQHFGYVRFDQQPMSASPTNMDVTRELNEATIFTSQSQALDALQTYVRNTNRWCSSLELHIVEEVSEPVRITRLGD